MIAPTRITSTATILMCVATQALFGCRVDPTTSKEPDSAQSRNDPAFGYIVGDATGGCPNQHRYWVASLKIEVAHGGYTTRIPQSGDWLVYMPTSEWASPATADSSIFLVTSEDSKPLRFMGYRFLEFAGPDSFVVSDPEYNLHLIDRRGTIQPLGQGASRPMTAETNGRIAAKPSGAVCVGIWNSWSDLAKGVAPLLLVGQEAAAAGESLVDVQWLGSSWLAIEFGAQSDAFNRVMVFEVGVHEALYTFPESRLIPAIGGRRVGVLATAGGFAEILSVGPDGRVAREEVRLRKDEWISTISPDGRFMVVASHRNQPPSGPAESSLRRVSNPTDVISHIEAGARFGGWYLCDCIKGN